MALLGPDGRVLAAASTLWFTVPRRDPAPREEPLSASSAGGAPCTARRGVGLTPMETRRDVIVRAAVLADELDYEVFAVPEGWGFDSGPVLTEIALRTTSIRVASGVLFVWGRSPATLAMTAATLHQISEGRYILGLGASTRALVEGFHDVPFEHPARQAARRRHQGPRAAGRRASQGRPGAPGAYLAELGSRPLPSCPSGSPRSETIRGG